MSNRRINNEKYVKPLDQYPYYLSGKLKDKKDNLYENKSELCIYVPNSVINV